MFVKAMRMIGMAVLSMLWLTPHAYAAAGEELKVAFGLQLPPYVFTNESGLEFDIVKSALEAGGYKLKSTFVPLARVPLLLKDRSVDAATPMIDGGSEHKHLHFSTSHITYQNVAVSLAENNLKINNVKDLKDFSIVAFQNAKSYLGDEYRQAIEKSKNYLEIAAQEKQIRRLFKKKTQVIVIDINIYEYFKNKLKDEVSIKPTIMHEIFPASHYKVGFVEVKARDAFNKGLEIIHKNGTREALVKKYRDL